MTLVLPGWTVHAALRGGARFGTDPSGRVSVIVHGELHCDGDGDPGRIARRYVDDPDGFAAGLNGSFALLVADRRRDRILAVTDRLSTRRLYWSLSAHGYWVTSDLAAQPRHEAPLDPVGIAWYLSSGAVYQRRSLYEGIRVLDRASVHELTPLGLVSREYWRHDLGPGHPARDDATTAGELLEVLERAVRRRIRDVPNVFVSLSGGHDSTVLAGLLGETGLRGIASFSYALEGRTQEGTDAAAAARTSAVLGYPHRVVRSYDGDLLQHLRWNAWLGEGMAHPCDEVDAWMAMARPFRDARFPVVITGGQILGTRGPSVDGMDSVRRRAGMRLFTLPAGLEDLLPPALLTGMRGGMDEDWERMVARQPDTDDPTDLLHYLTVDQRMVHRYLPWRERFTGKFAAPRPPLLDPDVLDFARTVPGRLRVGMRGFRQAAEERFPRLFAGPAPARGGYVFDLRAELIRHEAALRDWIRESSSRLDDLVPPELGLRLLEAEVHPIQPLKRRARLVARSVRRRFARPTGAGTSRPPPPLGGPTLFRRWAILRMATGADEA